MQELDENMDDLFRKAGNGYPLKTDANGWDKIAPLLLETPTILHVPGKKNNLKKYSALLILLLAFFLFGTLTSKYIWKNDKAVAGKLLHPESPANDAATLPAEAISTTNQASANQLKTTSKRQVINKRAAVTTTIIIPAPEEILSTDPANDLVAENTDDELKNPQESQPVENIASINNEKFVGEHQDLTKKNNETGSNKPTELSIKEEADKKQTTNEPSINKNVKKEKAGSKFYFGAIAGASLNQVKNQGLQKPGYDVGVKAGYQFTKQFSVEAGLIFEQKYYYTSGEYFNMSKIASAMPVGMKVVSLKGNFSVFELPLTFKYNLRNNNTKGHFYATAGVSTYLMSREYNQYKTLLNGSQNNMTGTYKNQSMYSASSLNISIGYEKTIGKSALVRIDPYIQFPLKGLGIGALPVTTVGIHLGVFRFSRQ